MGIATVKGSFNEFAGSLTVAADGTVAANGTVEVASIFTNMSQRDDHLKSPDFFDAPQFPQIGFTSTGVQSTGEDTFTVTGDLTIHGVTRSVTFEAAFEGQEVGAQGEDRVGLSVAGQINRRDFGLNWTAALGSGNAVVADNVRILLELSAVKA